MTHIYIYSNGAEKVTRIALRYILPIVTRHDSNPSISFKIMQSCYLLRQIVQFRGKKHGFQLIYLERRLRGLYRTEVSVIRKGSISGLCQKIVLLGDILLLSSLSNTGRGPSPYPSMLCKTLLQALVMTGFPKFIHTFNFLKLTLISGATSIKAPCLLLKS